MKRDQFIQIGVTALRDERTGEFLPAVPLYIEADDTAAAQVESLQRDLGKLFADRMRRYIEECKAKGIDIAL